MLVGHMDGSVSCDWELWTSKRKGNGNPSMWEYSAKDSLEFRQI